MTKERRMVKLKADVRRKIIDDEFLQLVNSSLDQIQCQI